MTNTYLLFALANKYGKLVCQRLQKRKGIARMCLNNSRCWPAPLLAIVARTTFNDNIVPPVAGAAHLDRGTPKTCPPRIKSSTRVKHPRNPFELLTTAGSWWHPREPSHYLLFFHTANNIFRDRSIFLRDWFIPSRRQVTHITYIFSLAFFGSIVGKNQHLGWRTDVRRAVKNL